MQIETYIQDTLLAINQAILNNDYNKFDSQFSSDIEEDNLKIEFPEVSKEHAEELGKLISFTKIEEVAVSNTENRLTFNGVFEKGTAIIMVLVRCSNDKFELLEHTYRW